MTKKKPGDKAEVRGVDPAWLLTKKLGISLAEAHARLAADEARENEAKAAKTKTTKEETTEVPPTE
jgi:hypothetical protein